MLGRPIVPQLDRRPLASNHHSTGRTFIRSIYQHDCCMSDGDEVRTQLAAQLAHHREMILRLSSQWNAFSPTYHLPQELLAEIFIHYVEDAISPAGQDERRPVVKRYRWIRITHICRHWRNVALSYPRLWSSILVTNPLWMAELLRRAGQVPLRVNAYLAESGSRGLKRMNAFKVVIRDANRISDLKLVLSFIQLAEFQEGLNQLMNDLERLDLTVVNASDFNEAYHTISLQATAPKLRHITLRDTHSIMPWSSTPFCPTMITLSCSSSCYSPKIVTTSEILNALEAMPLLEFIVLENMLSSEVLEDDGPRIVTLDHLRSISMSGDNLSPLACSTLLSHLVLPAVSEMTCSCSPIDTAAELLSPFTSILQRVTTVHVDVNDWTLNFYVWVDQDSVPIAPFFPRCPRGDFNLIFTNGSVLDLAPDILLGLCRNSPLSHLQTLVISLKAFSQENWEVLLAHMPRIVVLDVLDVLDSALARALCARSELRDGATDGLVLPRLHTLKLTQCSFVYPGNAEGMTSLDNLLFCLTGRQASGAGIRQLIMKDCFLPPQGDQDRLAELVHDMVVHSTPNPSWTPAAGSPHGHAIPWMWHNATGILPDEDLAPILFTPPPPPLLPPPPLFVPPQGPPILIPPPAPVLAPHPPLVLAHLH
ncbi:hypothetical protein OBBRIDRAFT_884226 [Obba rivulosa]|uniref:F-box domain-containing protein n=1 Tax=Obba rivulosa TaxID=1052685 RepID=A0A8E2DSU7_9APHY|nr:hypothetical protein OBBRIDRAFT_884226 [Obba rivulosa]